MWAPRRPGVGHGLEAGVTDREHVHPVDGLAGDSEGCAAGVERGRRRGSLERGSHRVLVVLDDEDHRQLPEARHVEGLVDLPLVGRAIAEVGEGDVVVAAVLVGKGQAGADRDVGADDAVAAIELLLLGEHVHRPALALGVARRPSGELGHDTLRVHAAGQHVPVIAVGRHALVAGLRRRLEADDDRLLADVEVAEAADHAHPVELPGLLLEPADQQHLAVEPEQLLLRHLRLRGASCRRHSPFLPGLRFRRTTIIAANCRRGRRRMSRLSGPALRRAGARPSTRRARSSRRSRFGRSPRSCAVLMRATARSARSSASSCRSRASCSSTCTRRIRPCSLCSAANDR